MIQIVGTGTVGAPPFTPLDLPDLIAWYRADELALSDNDPVATWDDLSGNGNHLTQATSGLRPILKTAIIDSKAVVRGDATDDMLQDTFTLNQPAHVFIVCKYRNTHSGSNDTAFDGGGNNQMRLFRNSSVKMYLYAGGFGPNFDTTPQNWHLYSCFYNGASSYLTVDNGTPATGDVGANNPGGLTFNTTGNGLEPGAVDSAEIIVCSAEVTGSDLTDLVGYFAAEYPTLGL